MNKIRFFSPASPKLLGTALSVTIFASACSSQQPQARQPQAVPVEVQTLAEGMLVDSNEFVGALEAQNRVQVAPRVEGRITEILVEEGESVRQGQLIVQLQLDRERAEVNARTSEINAQRANLANVEAQLRAAESEQNQAETEIARRQAELATAEAELQSRFAELQSREADLQLAETEFERTQFLVAQGAQAQQQLDQRIRDRDAALAERNAARRVLGAAQGARNAAISSLDSTREAFQAAQERVEAARATVEQEGAILSQAESQKEVSEQDLAYNRVTAPIDGVIGDILPKPGDYIDAGDVITTLTQNRVLSLNINIPLEDAPKLQVGLPLEIVDPQGNVEATGEVSFISPRADQSAQTVLAKAVFDNEGNLRDDQFVKARLIWEQTPGVLVPTTAVSRIGGQSFVFVAEQQTSDGGKTVQIAKQIPVELGDIQGQSYQIVSGVQPGEKVVVSGILNLSDGAPIVPESVQSEK